MRIFGYVIRKSSDYYESLRLSRMDGYERALEVIESIEAIYHGPVTMDGPNASVSNSLFYKINGIGVKMTSPGGTVTGCTLERGVSKDPCIFIENPTPARKAKNRGKSR
jgi:hypothetical protein